MLIDVNCDMGEGMPNDEQLMKFISSANIACGYHAGDEEAIRKTIRLCIMNNVFVGAHPSLPGRENFGRTEMPCTAAEISAWVIDQVLLVQRVACEMGVSVHHVKPHGALYNMAARDRELAAVVALAVREVDEDLELYGLSGSFLISEGKAAGLKTRSEVFADRSYEDDGSLTPRTMQAALITDVKTCLHQVAQMVIGHNVTSRSGKIIPIAAETICIHGDGSHALEFAEAISGFIEERS